MSQLSKVIGQRIRNYRLQLNYSQEKLAELSGCHPTYIGQLERGEKNATLESIAKITAALQVPMSTLFEKIDDESIRKSSYPLYCYELVASKSPAEQELIYHILQTIDTYKYI